MSLNKIPYHEKVAAEIIAALKDGTAPWIKPWSPGENPYLPVNALTGKPYKGWNRLYLGMSNVSSDNRWCTYKQASLLGGQVIKGSQGTQIQYWQLTEKRLVKDAANKPVLSEAGEKQYVHVKLTRPKVFHATVFHASQIDNLPPMPLPEIKKEWERHTAAEQILEKSGATIVHDQADRAFYSLGKDSIHLPNRNQFTTPDKFYATALHELGHWTGHPDRLGRDLAHPFGSEGYAKEELRAEISSFMLGTELGIGHDPGQHNAYIKSWIKVLEDDPLEIFRAARDAQAITTMVQELANDKTIDDSIHKTTEIEPVPRNAVEEPMMSEERIDLNVPYTERDDAKSLGAKWDKNEKVWFLPPNLDSSVMTKWLPKNQLEQDRPINPIEEFTAELKAYGLVIDSPVIMDGEWHRTKVQEGKSGSTDGAYKGYLDGHPAGFIRNFKTGEETSWKATGQFLNPDKVKDIIAASAIKKTAREAEQEQRYNNTSDKIKASMKDFNVPSADHPYLIEKNISIPLVSSGVKVDFKNNLVIPLHDENGKVWSVQRVSPTGFKQYEEHGRVKGCYNVIGDKDRIANTDEAILISTGFGTSAAISEAMDRPVVVTFQDSNMETVALKIREQYPDREIVILGDDDRHLPLKSPPLKNSGREAAEKTAASVSGVAIFPKFGDRENGREFTDFADISKRQGMDALKKQIVTAEQALIRSKSHDQKKTIEREGGRV